MNQEFIRLRQIFDSFPESVLYLNTGDLLPCNGPAEVLLTSLDASFREALLALKPSADCICTWQKACFHVTSSSLDHGHLLVLRPVSDPPNIGDLFSSFSAQLRGRLATLTAVSDQLAYSLRREGSLEKHEHLLAVLSHSVHRLLHFAQQTELHERVQEIPKQSLDVAGFCRHLSQEIVTLAELMGIRFLFESKLTSLLTMSNESLLRELLLALIASSLQSAQSEVGLRLSQLGNRVVFTIWDDGAVHSNVATIFSEPATDGLSVMTETDKWNFFIARQITAQFGGFLIAETQPEQGRRIALSLPIEIPDQISLRSDEQEDGFGGFSPVLVGLSSVLPWQAFIPREEY